MNSIQQKQKIKNEIEEILQSFGVEAEITVEKPKERSYGDYAIPCFSLAKVLRKSPNDIAMMIQEKIKKEEYESLSCIGGYLNLFLKKDEVTKHILKDVLSQKEHYGDKNIGQDKTIVLDYSSPNIAKPFGVGHLRSTVIGNAIKNICKKLGYHTVGIDYLGDWGTQFGKIICAYQIWGNEEMLKKNTIDEIQRLYVKFHEEAKIDDTLNDKARACFKELEQGNKEYEDLWNILRNASIQEFMKTYELLGITDFDSFDGEAAANKKSKKALELIEEKNLLEEDDGAYIIRLEGVDTPAMIKKKDGSSLYMTREIAEVIDRKERYHFDEILYVVGNEQTLHFKQLKEVIHKLGYSWFDKIHHINFGLFLQGGKKMSTRQGKSMKLQDVLEESVALAETYIQEKNPTLEKKQEISKAIGVGAVIFNDLKNYRINDVEFNLEDVLRFEGETGPYVQYTYARIHTILEKQKIVENIYDNVEVNEYVWNIISRIFEFDEMLLLAKRDYDPSVIAKFTLDLCKDFNKFYANHRIITEDPNATNFRLQIATITAIMIKESMRILGIKVPTKM